MTTTETSNNTSSSSNISIFTKLDKYCGQNNEDLTCWFRGFERCCVIAGKNDDLVKGQLLMLCLCGQALAVAERLEEEQKTPQKYSELKTRLKAVFNSEAEKELKQIQFEKRHEEIHETDDEFMLELIKLHRAANPDADDTQVTCNVKRKFLSGISVELKRNIFIFCSDPHATTVTIENLLEATRKARLFIMEGNDSHNSPNINAVENAPQDISNMNVVENGHDQNNKIFEAIENLTKSLNDHVKLTNDQFKLQETQINSITANQNSRRTVGNYSIRQNYNRRQDSRRNRGNARNSTQQNNEGSITDGAYENNGSNYGRSDSVVCFKCNQPNHYARNCTLSRESLN